MPMVVAEMRAFDHGDTDDRPSPTPSVSRMREREAEAKPPAMIAAQDTPDNVFSTSPTCSVVRSASVQRETPRLCRGGSKSLTDTGVHQGNSKS